MPQIPYREKPMTKEEMKAVAKEVHREMSKMIKLFQEVRKPAPSATFRCKDQLTNKTAPEMVRSVSYYN